MRFTDATTVNIPLAFDIVKVETVTEDDDKVVAITVKAHYGDSATVTLNETQARAVVEAIGNALTVERTDAMDYCDALHLIKPWSCELLRGHDGKHKTSLWRIPSDWDDEPVIFYWD